MHRPVGFGLGLTLGGVLADSIGWRFAFYLSAILTAIVGVVALFTVPKDQHDRASISWQRFASDIDWVGACMASTSLAGLSYVLA